MKDEPTVSFPVRMPTSLSDDIKAMCEWTGLSQQDVMRLAMRIGLADLSTAGKDFADVIRQAAQDQGLSFADWTKMQRKKEILPIPSPEDIAKDIGAYATTKDTPGGKVTILTGIEQPTSLAAEEADAPVTPDSFHDLASQIAARRPGAPVVPAVQQPGKKAQSMKNPKKD